LDVEIVEKAKTLFAILQETFSKSGIILTAKVPITKKVVGFDMNNGIMLTITNEFREDVF
jgi:hypothetical protein